MKKIVTFENYIDSKQEWSSALVLLREVVLSVELHETIKWNSPVYTYNGKNIVGLSAFKAYMGLWFYQGALLSDKYCVLINAQENKTVAMRQWRFKTTEEIVLRSSIIKEYVQEAVENQMAGREIKPKRDRPIVIPPLLLHALQIDRELNNIFNALGKTRRREFAEYVGEAKKEETKVSRIKKIIKLIRDRRGLHDKYR